MFTDATGLSTSRFLPLGGKAGAKPAGVPASPLDGASLPGAPMRAGRDKILMNRLAPTPASTANGAWLHKI